MDLWWYFYISVEDWDFPTFLTTDPGFQSGIIDVHRKIVFKTINTVIDNLILNRIEQDINNSKLLWQV